MLLTISVFGFIGLMFGNLFALFDFGCLLMFIVYVLFICLLLPAGLLWCGFLVGWVIVTYFYWLVVELGLDCCDCLNSGVVWVYV